MKCASKLYTTLAFSFFGRKETTFATEKYGYSVRLLKYLCFWVRVRLVLPFYTVSPARNGDVML